MRGVPRRAESGTIGNPVAIGTIDPIALRYHSDVMRQPAPSASPPARKVVVNYRHEPKTVNAEAYQNTLFLFIPTHRKELNSACSHAPHH